MNGKHSIVVCFPTGKKKSEFSYPSPQYSKISPKRSYKALPCCSFANVNYCRTKRMRLFRHNQPTARRPSPNLSACCKKTTSWHMIKSRLCTFLAHIYQYSCAMITKIAVNSSSDLKYCYSIYSANHLQEEARMCSSLPYSLVLTYSVFA